MLRYRNKPPRRPKPKPVAKAAPRPGSDKFQMDGAYGMLFGLFGALIVARLVIGAAAGSTQIATVGDRLEFNSATIAPVLGALEVPARLITDPWAPAGAACSLNIAAMSHPGGALTVMAVRPDGVMLSWAGGETSSATADCHDSTEAVLVTDTDYATLLKALSPKH